MKEIENNMYYQTGIKTSRNEDSVYAMKYASQQMMTDKLQKENQELKKQLEEKNNKLNSVLDYIDSNIFIEQFENVGNENNVRKEIIKRITNDIEVE